MNRSTDDISWTHCAAERRYRQARACLEQAQVERTRAVYRFLEAQAAWKADAAPAGFRVFRGHTASDMDPLAQAEADLQQAKEFYATALEQHSALERLLAHARIAYERAQQNLDRLALEDTEERR